MDREIEFYIRIIEETNSLLMDQIKFFIWKCHKIIKLMEELKKENDSLYIKNALILLLNSFEDCFIDFRFDDTSNLNKMSNYDKDLLIFTLKEEFQV